MSLYRFSFAMLALLAPLAHGAAICDDTMDRTAPSARFLDHGNGTVTDQHTGLTWMRCKLGQTWSGSSCLGEPTVYYWQQGLQVAERIRSDSSHALYHFGGISQWRLPDIKELATLVAASERVPECLSNHLLRFAGGRAERAGDAEAARWLAAELQKEGYSVRGLLLSLVSHPNYALRVEEP